MYRFEESRRLKKLKFKEVAPRFLSKSDFLNHFTDEIFENTEATCEFEVVGVHDTTMLDLEQKVPFVMRKVYKQKFHTLPTAPTKVDKVVKKRKRRWRSKSPFDKRRRRWVSPSTRRA